LSEIIYTPWNLSYLACLGLLRKNRAISWSFGMSISTIEIQPTLAAGIAIDEELLTIDFVDGRSIS